MKRITLPSIIPDEPRSSGGVSWKPFAAVGVLAPVGLLSTNPLLTAAALLVLSILLALTWRPGQPQVLAFAVTFQWFQASTKVLHADALGLPVDALATNSSSTWAIWLSLLGLVALAIGMRVGAGSRRADAVADLQHSVMLFDPGRLAIAYFSFVAISVVLILVGRLVPTVAQAMNALVSLKWIFLFMLACVALGRAQGRVWLGAAVAFEVGSGFLSYFSSFKEALFVLLIAFATVWHLGGRRNPIGIIVTVAAILLLGLVWTAIKPEYRNYLNDGTGQQVVLRSPSEQIAELFELAGDLDARQFGEAATDIAGRIAYVDYFGDVLETVPRDVPHSDGALWGAAINHVLTPRLLFPAKPALGSDSELTMRYTGRQLASEEQGTSISMGYMAESYIDFGSLGMMLPVLIVGLTWGLMYRYFTSVGGDRLLYGFGAAVAVLIDANQLEMHNVKLLGGMLTNFIVVALWCRFGVPVIDPLLRQRSNGRGSWRAA